MADVVDSGFCSPEFLTNSEGHDAAIGCQRCYNYEVLLNEALEELNSIQTINKLLQKELQICAAFTNTWGFNLDYTDDISELTDGKEWTLVTKKYHMVNSNKQFKSALPVTNQLTQNRKDPSLASPRWRPAQKSSATTLFP
jgi:hypothetical protein